MHQITVTYTTVPAPPQPPSPPATASRAVIACCTDDAVAQVVAYVRHQPTIRMVNVEIARPRYPHPHWPCARH